MGSRVLIISKGSTVGFILLLLLLGLFYLHLLFSKQTPISDRVLNGTGEIWKQGSRNTLENPLRQSGKLEEDKNRQLPTKPVSEKVIQYVAQ